MMQLIVEPQPVPTIAAQPLEVVERKGIGHPDTICDALAEQFSATLSRYYLEHFGFIAHHNVDKVLLRGGCSAPAFGGGEVREPIEVYLCGRATDQIRGRRVPLEALGESACRDWLAAHVHALDAQRDVRVHVITHPGSSELVELFKHQQRRGKVLCNDTSCSVGYWPLSPLERAVAAVESALNSERFKREHPCTGEDVKVMGIRRGSAGSMTVACALIDRHIASLGDYMDAIVAVEAESARAILEACDLELDVKVNAADSPERGDIYLTVTGTSAECGDDGNTGRGNRPNGLITPFRPMTMEAAAGKNPVSHVGKLYGVVAAAVARRCVEEIDVITSADCVLVSQIGLPISEPQVACVRVELETDARFDDPGLALRASIDALVHAELAGLATLHERIVEGAISFY